MDRHRSYVLRCIAAHTRAHASGAWRFTLQVAAANEPRHAFSSLEKLLAFLRDDLEKLAPDDAGK